mgnify:CR=1 FL=1
MEFIFGLFLDMPLLFIVVLGGPFGIWGWVRFARFFTGEESNKIHISFGVKVGAIVSIIFGGITFLGLFVMGIFILLITRSKEDLLKYREQIIKEVEPQDILDLIEHQMINDVSSDRLKAMWYGMPEQERFTLIQEHLSAYRAYLSKASQISPFSKELMANWEHGIDVVAGRNALSEAAQ